MGTPSFSLYLDDSGVRYPDRKPALDRHDGMDCFALGGLLIETEALAALTADYDRLTSRYGIGYPLHSHKIRARKDTFRWLESDPVTAAAFYQDLERFLCGIPGYAVGCCIDRPGYHARYAGLYGKDPWKLCKSAYAIVVERAAKWAIRHERKLIVFVEQTGKREDSDIARYHRDMLAQGMYFHKERSGKYDPLSGPDLAKTLMKNPNFVKKDNKAAQVADLILYPIVKGGYDPTYRPYRMLWDAGKIIDSVLEEEERLALGVKYYCFSRVP